MLSSRGTARQSLAGSALPGGAWERGFLTGSLLGDLFGVELHLRHDTGHQVDREELIGLFDADGIIAKQHPLAIAVVYRVIAHARRQIVVPNRLARPYDKRLAAPLHVAHQAHSLDDHGYHEVVAKA